MQNRVYAALGYLLLVTSMVTDRVSADCKPKTYVNPSVILQNCKSEYVYGDIRKDKDFMVFLVSLLQPISLSSYAQEGLGYDLQSDHGKEKMSRLATTNSVLFDGFCDFNKIHVLPKGTLICSTKPFTGDNSNIGPSDGKLWYRVLGLVEPGN